MGDHVIDIAELIISILISIAPKDTWNMVNTIGYIVYDDNKLDILIGGDFAPYAPYTNEKWVPSVDILHKKRNGKLVDRTENEKRNLKSYATGGENPNEGWLNRALEQATILLASYNMGAVISNV